MKCPDLAFLQLEWPGGFRYGRAVRARGRDAHVAAMPPGEIPDGEVPIIYDDESGSAFSVPADDISPR